MSYVSDYRYVAFITGCSSGIGFATSLFLAEKGVRVFATVRMREKMAFLDEEAAKRGVGHLLTPLELNVDNWEEIGKLTQMVLEREKNALERGSELILINNAGFGVVGALEDLSLEAYERQLKTNFFGAVALTKAFVPAMRERGKGKIIQISSAYGRFAGPLVSAYAASKFALEGFSESLRYELYRYGVYVSLIEPGPVLTNFVENINYAEGHETSLYRDFYQKYQDLSQLSFLIAQSSADIASLIWEIIQDPSPKLRYPVGITLFAENLRRFLPDPFWDEIFRFF